MMVLIKAWDINNQRIELLQEGGALRTTIRDKKTGRIRPYLIPLEPGKTLAYTIDYLMKCDVLLKATGAPTYSIPRRQWTIGSKVVSLHCRKDGLIFDVFDRTTKTSIHKPAAECITPSHRCHEDTVAKLEAMKGSLKDDFYLFLNKFNVTCVIDPTLIPTDFDTVASETIDKLYAESTPSYALKTFRSGRTATLLTAGSLFCPGMSPVLGMIHLAKGAMETSYQQYKVRENISLVTQSSLARYDDRMAALAKQTLPFLLEIEPISAPSKIDSCVRVSQLFFGVTLICHGGIDDNHASIIVEGISNGVVPGLDKETIGNYFMYKSDLQDQSEIYSTLFTDKLEIEQRTPIWKVASTKAIAMLKSIHKQIRKIDEDLSYEVKFSVLGPTKENPDVHNCFTWAREKLKKAGIIDLGTKSFLDSGLFPFRTKNYTSLGHSLSFSVIPVNPSILLNNLKDMYDYTDESLTIKELI